MTEEFHRMRRLPPYVFAEVNRAKAAARAAGEDIIDLGMGNPDTPTPPHIVAKLVETVADPRSHRYSVSRGIPGLRRALATYYRRRFGVELDAETEVVATLGSKEGLANLASAITSPGDTILVPNPSYPIHQFGFIIAGAAVRSIPAEPGDGMLAALDRAVRHSVPKPTALIVNFPSNPTAFVADLDFYRALVAFARRHEIWIMSDLAYAEIYFGDRAPPSILQVEGAKDVAVEFTSMSKTYSMAGWRMGFAAGNPRLISALTRMKSYLDYGAFTPIQVASVAALTGPQDCVEQVRQLYRERRDVLIRGLSAAGWEVPSPEGSMFAWAPIPPAYAELGSVGFAKLLMAGAKVAVAPGLGFGEHGEGFVRIGLVENTHRLRQATRSIKAFLQGRANDVSDGQAGERGGGRAGEDPGSERVSEGASRDTLRVGIAGLGTVGAATVRLLRENAALIAARAGRAIVPVAVSARDRGRGRGVSLDGLEWHDSAEALATADGVDVVVEVIGGADGPALVCATAALAAGRHVVTANKAMIAHHGVRLAALAERRGVRLAFEAAVAGGIPVLKAVRESLAGNRLSRVAGILNGTCNHILTTMRETGREFADVLAEAQALGYAEADPAADIDGVDTAHKLAILAALAFDRVVPFEAVHVEGIRPIEALDIGFADELGFRIKLLGIARATADGIEARVHPCLVPAGSPLARVDGVYNAVVAEGDFAGRITLEGRGAGGGPTASAVVGDLIDIARNGTGLPWGRATAALATGPMLPISAHHGAYYLRLVVLDRPGVIAEVAAALRDAGVSLKSMLQHGRAPGEAVPVVLVTHETSERAMRDAADRITRLEVVVRTPLLIRIEPG